jgi:hypothetical protein
MMQDARGERRRLMKRREAMVEETRDVMKLIKRLL